MERIEHWFKRRGWEPFEFQRETWQAYLRGDSGLVHAPTGVGKTLSVWLGPVAEYLRESLMHRPEADAPRRKRSARTATRVRRERAEPLRVLWLTPLRALAADTVASMREPVEDLRLPWLIESRTGDTNSTLRAKQRERLPTALVTTPESLSVLLSYADARERMKTLRCVVVDEWHELLSTKRGVQTELALARLRAWLPRLRVWGLSATLGNLRQARDVLMGTRGAGVLPVQNAECGRVEIPAPPAMIEARLHKNFELTTLVPEDIESYPWAGHIGVRMVDAVIEEVARARTALLFTNTRSQAEIWFRAITLKRPDWLGTIAIHHGSLERAIRGKVEQKLKAGELRAVVCTSSLDLGVDFSPVDMVFQLGSPKGIARILQRAGRSGHQPGATSRVVCVPTHAFELVEFAAARAALDRRDVEAREPLRRPMDVLAQHIVTVACGGGFVEDELFEEVRTSHAYRELTREQWQWAMDFVMQGGQSLAAYPDFKRIVQRDGRWVIASDRMARMHRLNIGTIPSDVSMTVQMLNGRKLGTIEESFISRLAEGDTFVFAGNYLTLQLVRGMTAYVRKAKKTSGRIPRWDGTRFPLSTQLGQGVREQMTRAMTGEPGSPEMIAAMPLLSLQAATSIVPGPDELLIEHTRSRDGDHWFVFPFEGRLVHEGLASLLAYRLARMSPRTVNLTATDYGMELLCETEMPLSEPEWRALLSPEGLVDDLLACVNCTQMARRQFRDIARVAGLIMASYPGSQKPTRHLQASSEMFFDVLTEFDGESLLLEQARREVLEQQLEVNRMRAALERIAARPIRMIAAARLTPLSFPIWAERLRAQYVTTEKWSERVKRMAIQLEAAEDGGAVEFGGDDLPQKNTPARRGRGAGRGGRRTGWRMRR
ncbi:MAG: ligase-associated DNA damage response DEXH box helicase [Phycisphaerae bacterium]